MDPNNNVEIKSIIEGVRANLQEHPDLTPMFFVHTKSGENVACVLDIQDGAKEALADFMRKFALEHDAEWTLFLTECWMKKYSPENEAEELKDTRPIRDREGREEAVLFSLETYEDGCYTAICPLKYKADKKVILDVTFEKTAADQRGTFTNLLPNKKAVAK